MGNMKANRKFVEGEEAVSAVIGVILMVAITVAIAATVYVYVSGMLGGTTGTETEGASVAVTAAADDRIKVTLTRGGQNYDETDGYSATDVNIFIDGYEVEELATSPSTWYTGEPVYIGLATDTPTAPRAAATTGFADGIYDVSVSILGTAVHDGQITIT
jgi:flagellin-like protein